MDIIFSSIDIVFCIFSVHRTGLRLVTMIERERDNKASIVDNKMAINLMPWTLYTRPLNVIHHVQGHPLCAIWILPFCMCKALSKSSSYTTISL
jgi:hypothetical protein